ncbi:2OG-Fe(II) oxygenase [Haliscomenobacter hydrossis]|uniref:Uncharacterized protein n=1 Tax=Haliscomenobacter hydrossis (strain ATCC 27775 / DSM 1100 / LMG 10767 / O) TaxID=760192 RepID=F4L5A9_HALH1|nr:2OG-Fe(II) oxygenase [Haliscomenobacter hydrossis]AEE49789.1 hypothetical protein Halhy_1904 [Haliscomenobacter hydrossis DSM 1100]
MKKELFSILETITGNGSFETSGVLSFVPPGLSIKGVGEVAFPLTTTQAKAIVAKARQAPFGKGSQTITDTSVRKVWEIDPAMVTIQNPAWTNVVLSILQMLREGLGLGDVEISASLYKLLLYEKGGFFLSHQDSEKEKGMFGTLVIGLPSVHEGGQLLVSFGGREKAIDFSSAKSFEIPFAAFFADCEHEIQPVTSGYRLCLTYNLLQKTKKSPIGVSDFSEQTKRLATFFKTNMAKIEEEWPKIILLDHQYTPANFSQASLKLHDRPRAAALLEAAEAAGMFAKLGLLTHYQSGELEIEYDSRRSRGRRWRGYDDDYDNEDLENGSMGEVYDEYSTLEHWAEDGIPGLGELSFELEDHIWSKTELGAGEPIEKAAEGFTGNAGMSMEYWYHYGAVVIWPQAAHFDILSEATGQVILDWLAYYTRNIKNTSIRPKKSIEQLLTQLSETINAGHKIKAADFSPFAHALVLLKDPTHLETAQALLVHGFSKIDVTAWLALARHFSPKALTGVFEEVGKAGKVKKMMQALKVLSAFEAEKKADFDKFVQQELAKLPERLQHIPLSKIEEDRYSLFEERKENILSIVSSLLHFGAYGKLEKSWTKDVLGLLIEPMPRKYANDILASALLKRDYTESELSKQLREICMADLEKRTAEKPMPPADFTRIIPQNADNSKNWTEILVPFLSSPTQSDYHYVANESLRKDMESTIKYSGADLRTETIAKGRPFTLRIIKTQASFERLLAEWIEDTGLLGKLKMR